jgi:NADH dehydrogenase FAD-containing subunit
VARGLHNMICISQKNFFLFTPMLHEVAASNSSRKFRPLTTQLSQRSPSHGSTARTRQNGNP